MTDLEIEDGNRALEGGALLRRASVSFLNSASVPKPEVRGVVDKEGAV